MDRVIVLVKFLDNYFILKVMEIIVVMFFLMEEVL